MRKLAFAVVAAIAALGLTGCGDAPQELAQKERRYQGKPDANPWDSAEFGGDKAKWETALRTRQLNQNEYTRTE